MKQIQQLQFNAVSRKNISETLQNVTFIKNLYGKFTNTESVGGNFQEPANQNRMTTLLMLKRTVSSVARGGGL